MSKSLLHVAEALAADLAGAQVDPNEAQKALAYLRSRGEGRALFDYLQAVVSNGSAVIRSGRTLGYYRDLLAICQRHLRPLQGDYQRLLETYAWSLRLLRYYRAVPWAAEEKAAERRGEPAEAPRPAAHASAAPPQPAGPALPAVGETFTGKVLDGDDDAFIIAVPGFDAQAAVAVLRVGPGVPKYRLGKDSAKVQVTAVKTTKSGRSILEVERPG